MRHRVAHRQFSRDTDHRRALRRSLVANLIEHESIVTTLPKAKEIKAFAEKLITLAKRDTVNARRRAVALLNERRITDEDAPQKTIIDKLFKTLGPRFVDRPGGYTRIVRLAGRRLGDGSAKTVLQFVDQALASTGVKSRRTTKAGHSREGSRKVPAQQDHPQTKSDQSPQAQPSPSDRPTKTADPQS